MQLLQLWVITIPEQTNVDIRFAEFTFARRRHTAPDNFIIISWGNGLSPDRHQTITNFQLNAGN